MCETSTISTIISLASTAGSAIYSGVQAKKAQQAQDDAAMRETARQKRLQGIQTGMIGKQEEEKRKGRQVYEALQPQLNVENTNQIQAAATDQRNTAYQAATQQTGADPTQGGAETAVVDSPAERPLAVANAFKSASDKGQAYSSQQAGARAFIDALSDAQRQAGVNLSRGAEQIGMHGDFVSGMNRPLSAYEAAKNGQQVFLAQSQAAAQEGADGVAAGQAIGQLGQLAYGYGTTAKKKPTGQTQKTTAGPIR